MTDEYARLLLAIGIIVLIVCSLCTYLGRFHRLFELTNHFRLQYGISAVVATLAMTAWQQWVWAAVAGGVLVLNLIYLYPWVIGGRRKSVSSPTAARVTLIGANVQYNNTQYAQMLNYLLQVNRDLVVLQEVTKEWAKHLEPLKELYPHYHVEARHGGGGIALYSKLPFEKVAPLILGSEKRPSLYAQVRIGDQIVHLLAAHPLTPIAAAKFAGSKKEIEAVTEFLAQTATPKILLGDLNDTMWSHRHGKLLKNTQMRNVRAGRVIHPTWPTWLYFRLLMLPLDHCLVSADIDVIAVKAGDNVGSDHLPLIVELAIPQPR